MSNCTPSLVSSLVWQGIDRSLFDYEVDHYRILQIEDKYLGFLRPGFAHSKPVVITEFGYATCREGLGSEGFLDSSGLRVDLIDVKITVSALQDSTLWQVRAALP